MADPRRTAKWKQVLGYVGFAVGAFVFGLYVTFPYEVLKKRIASEAGAQGFYVKMASLGPGFFGITASRVELSRKMDAAEEKPPVPLQIDSVAIRPSLFPPGVAVRAKLLRGTASAAIGLVGDFRVRAALDDLNLQDDNLKAFSGFNLAGRVNAQLSLDLPNTSPTRSMPAEPDLSQATGSVSLDLTDAQVNGGTVGYIDLPKVAIGDVEAKIKFEKGAGTIDKLHAKSDELELLGTGTLKLARRIDFSEPNATLKFKAQPDLLKRLGMIAAGMGMLPTDPQSPDFRTLRVNGFLGRPSSPDLRF
jgi:type II secretion system protein N